MSPITLGIKSKLSTIACRTVHARLLPIPVFELIFCSPPFLLCSGQHGASLCSLWITGACPYPCFSLSLSHQFLLIIQFSSQWHLTREASCDHFPSWKSSTSLLSTSSCVVLWLVLMLCLLTCLLAAFPGGMWAGQGLGPGLACKHLGLAQHLMHSGHQTVFVEWMKEWMPEHSNA